MADKIYKRPYLDSGVFIAWIKGEVVKEKLIGGGEVAIDRGKIGEHILTLAEQQLFPIIISALTIAEVHKKKGSPRLPNDENENILKYFEHDFVNPIPIDRAIGEEANRLCRLHGLSPCDAIHLACAKKAGCDVLLSWDEGLNGVADPSIRTERPRIQNVGPEIHPQAQMTLDEILDGSVAETGDRKDESAKLEPLVPSVMGDEAPQPESMPEHGVDEAGERKPETQKAERGQNGIASILPTITVSPDELMTTEILPESKTPAGDKPAGDGDGSKPVVDAEGIEPSSAESQRAVPKEPEDNPPLSH